MSCEAGQRMELIRKGEQAEKGVYFREVDPVSYIQETMLYSAHGHLGI